MGQVMASGGVRMYGDPATRPTVESLVTPAGRGSARAASSMRVCSTPASPGPRRDSIPRPKVAPRRGSAC